MPSSVLVTGATGNQGGAVARELLAGGCAVRVLVRAPDAPRARELASGGATLVRGDLDDVESLRPAMAGATGVFSVQTPGLTGVGGGTEVRQARNIATAARAAGVEHIVHTSVSGADGGPVDDARWGTFPGLYRAAKIGAENEIKAAGSRWTVLRPALFLENFVRPSFYFPDPDRPDHLLVALDLDVAQAWVALRDIGRAAVAAFADPTRFDGIELELAGDRKSFRQVAGIVSAATGREITLPDSPEQARADGVPAKLARYQDYVSAHPYPAQPEAALAFGLAMTTVEQWARATFVDAART